MVRFLAISYLCLLIGCQSETGKTTTTSAIADKPAAQVTPKKTTIRSRESLNLDETLSDAIEVEPKKLKIASPKEWGWASRSSDYVARFYLDKTRRTRLPRIWITSENLSQPKIETVTPDNVIEYASQVASRLKSESDKKLLESVKPMIIGDRPCARYVRKTRYTFRNGNKKSTLVVERQVLQTIVAGRQFTVELHVLPGDIEQFRDLAYAVLAGMTFLPESDAAGKPATDDTSEEAPAKPETDSP